MGQFKVLVPQKIAQEGIKLLEENGCTIVYTENDEIETVKEAVADCDAVLVRTTIINEEIINQAKKLKVIARHGVGLDNIDVEAATKNNIYVCNAPTSNIKSVAEHVVGLMTAVSHQIVRADKAIRKGEFGVRNTYIGTELDGKTVGLIGLGNIGKLVAKKCALGFDMNVIAYDPKITSICEDYIELVDSIDEVMIRSDFVTLHVPYLKPLHHFIDKKMIGKMKSTAYFINAARGGLVDEEALFQALISGKIAGAGLDCFEEEPTPKDHPIFGLEQVVVTPHMAAHTKDAMVRMAVDPANEILRLKNNEKLMNPVNIPIGTVSKVEVR